MRRDQREEREINEFKKEDFCIGNRDEIRQARSIMVTRNTDSAEKWPIMTASFFFCFFNKRERERLSRKQK